MAHSVESAAQRDETIAACAEGTAEPDEGERLEDDGLHVLTADADAERQHHAEEQEEQKDARPPLFAGEREQHRQPARQHGGVQRAVKHAVRQRAQRRIRRQDRLKAGFPDRQAKQTEQQEREHRAERRADERQPAHFQRGEDQRKDERCGHAEDIGVLKGQR